MSGGRSRSAPRSGRAPRARRRAAPSSRRRTTSTKSFFLRLEVVQQASLAQTRLSGDLARRRRLVVPVALDDFQRSVEDLVPLRRAFGIGASLRHPATPTAPLRAPRPLRRQPRRRLLRFFEGGLDPFAELLARRAGTPLRSDGVPRPTACAVGRTVTTQGPPPRPRRPPSRTPRDRRRSTRERAVQVQVGVRPAGAGIVDDPAVLPSPPRTFRSVPAGRPLQRPVGPDPPRARAPRRSSTRPARDRRGVSCTVAPRGRGRGAGPARSGYAGSQGSAGRTGDHVVDPVGDRAERVVVEGGHLAGVDVPSGSMQSQRSQIVVAPIVTG